MRIAVLGATSLLGHHTARAVKSAGHELVLIHRPESRVGRLNYLEPECHAVERLDYVGLRRALKDIDAVVRCDDPFPQKPRRWQEEVASALDEANHFYAACLAAHVPRILYVGSSIALPRHPEGLPGHEGLFYEGMPRWRNPFLLTRWALDEQAREQARSGLPVIIGIPGMSLGEMDFGPSTGRLITAIGSGQMTHYVAGRRNLIDAADAGRGLLLTLEKGRVGERYLLTGQNIEMKALTERVAQLLGVAPPQPMPLALARGMAVLGRLRYRLSGEAPMLDDVSVAFMVGGQFLDGSKARNELRFVAETPLEETLERTIRWFRANGYL